MTAAASASQSAAASIARRKKTGGRKRGTPNKSTVARQAALAALKHPATDPISFFCSVLQDENAPRAERRDAANKLLPYYHPRLEGLSALLIEFAGEGDSEPQPPQGRANYVEIG